VGTGPPAPNWQPRSSVASEHVGNHIMCHLIIKLNIDSDTVQQCDVATATAKATGTGTKSSTTIPPLGINSFAFVCTRCVYSSVRPSCRHWHNRTSIHIHGHWHSAFMCFPASPHLISHRIISSHIIPWHRISSHLISTQLKRCV